MPQTSRGDVIVDKVRILLRYAVFKVSLRVTPIQAISAMTIFSRINPEKLRRLKNFKKKWYRPILDISVRF